MESTEGSGDSKGWLERIAALLLAAAAFVPFTLPALPAADLWWDLSNGKLRATTGSIPAKDVFSFIAEGQPWQNDEWLACWLAYLIYDLGGLNLLYLYKSTLLVLTFGLLIWYTQKRVQGPLWAPILGGVLCMLFAQTRFFFDVRPYLYTYLFLVVQWLIVQHYVDTEDKRWAWSLPVVTAVWVNFHAGCTAGMALMGAAVVGLLLDKQKRALAPTLIGACVGSVITSGFNINGYHIITYPYRLLNSIWSRHLNEWQPLIQDGALRDGYGLYVGFMLVTLLMCLGLHKRLGLHTLFVMGGFAFLSLTGWRHIILFCFLAVYPWGAAITWLLQRVPAIPKAAWAVVGACSILFIGQTFAKTDLPSLSREKQMFPYWAGQFMMANDLPHHFFHPYGWGGYLSWMLHSKAGSDYRVFIDGRAVQVYTTDQYYEYLKVAHNTPEAQDILKKYDVQMVLCFSDRNFPECSIALLDGRPEWTKIYNDPLATIYLRVSEANRERLQRFERGAFVYPDNPSNLVEKAREEWQAKNLAQAEAHCRRAIELDREYAPAYLNLGSLLLMQGRAEGVLVLEEALEWNPHIAGAHQSLAIYFSERDAKRAVQEAQAELKVNPQSSKAREIIRRFGN